MKFIQNQIVENYFSPAPKQLDEIDALYEKTLKDLPKHIRVDKDVLNSFMIKDQLNPEFWHNDKLNPQVRQKLLKIAKDFFADLELDPKIKMLDILFVGSMANYNWSKFSDIDLHVVVDFKDFGEDKDFMQKFFNANKNNFNNEHNIKMHGYNVEMYVQDLHEKLSSSAVFSVMRNKWIVQPKEVKFKIDKSVLRRKILKMFDKLRNIEKNYKHKQFQKVVDEVDEVFEQIKKMRKSGLERGGEFSLENILYKIFRRTDIFDLLDTYKNKSYDQLVTLNEY